MMIRRELPEDVDAIHGVTAAAFRLAEHSAPPVEPGGDPTYYRRFGFVPSTTVGTVAPDPAWGELFQVRTLTAYDGQVGTFRYAAPHDRL